MALLMAAIMHDYRHPGVNNSYLIRHLDPLAVMYNDSSVLENFHASEGFKLMMDSKFDIFKVGTCIIHDYSQASSLRCDAIDHELSSFPAARSSLAKLSNIMFKILTYLTSI